jgi:hypothetical protein
MLAAAVVGLLLTTLRLLWLAWVVQGVEELELLYQILRHNPDQLTRAAAAVGLDIMVDHFLG